MAEVVRAVTFVAKCTECYMAVAFGVAAGRVAPDLALVAVSSSCREGCHQ